MINKTLKIKNNELYARFNKKEIGVLLQNQEQLKLLIDIFNKNYNFGTIYYSNIFPCVVEESFYKADYGHMCIRQYYSALIDEYNKEKVNFEDIFDIVYKEHRIEEVVELIQYKHISIDDFVKLLGIDKDKTYNFENIKCKEY
jgi:hypothetical protein